MAEKELIIVGGANGVGKTTIATKYASKFQGLYLGADAIAAELNPDAPELVALAAGKEMLRRITAAFANEQVVVIESTLAGRTMRHVIHGARDAGFTNTMAYLFLDTADHCVQRIHERVEKGGHAVPKADIRRRFLRSIRNFWHLYRPLVDHWWLIHNSGQQPLNVAAGTADEVFVRDADIYATFTRRIEGDRDG